MDTTKDKIKAIAIYLPQYHPIPENNKWWGEGFTEWTNVASAKPIFENHYQPHIPADLGFYDLRLDEVRIQQAEMAKKYGIYGFCYYHYWFNGKQLLEYPIKRLLESKEPNFPFCICWANENWTRTWDGLERNILMPQNHNLKDDVNFIKSVIPFFQDERYITIKKKPVLIIYRTELFPNIKETTEIWRKEVRKAGFDDLYLIRVEGFVRNISPKEIGFDAAMEFAPDYHVVENNLNVKLGLKESAKVYDYEIMMKNMIKREKPDYKLFRCVTPQWDNTARKGENATILLNSSPEAYRWWLNQIVEYTNNNFHDDEKIIFINAWNEWGEGNHLEPDLRYGKKYLEFTKTALDNNEKDNIDIDYVEKLIYENKYMLAKELIEFLLEQDKNNLDLLNNLSVILILMQKYDEALITLSKVLNLDHQNSIALENINYLDSIIGNKLEKNKEIER